MKLFIFIIMWMAFMLVARVNASEDAFSDHDDADESKSDTLIELSDATIEEGEIEDTSALGSNRDGLDLSALLNVKHHLRSVVRANLDELSSSEDEGASPLIVSKAQANSQLLNEQSESFIQQREQVLLELEINSGERRQLWSIEESDKQRCCAAAFDLCEKPPTMTYKRFWKIKDSLLRRARRACDDMGIFSRLNEKTICSYYKGHPMNCAMTPNTPKDMDRYNIQAKICCQQSPLMCDNMENATILFQAKRECFYFAARTPDDICGMQDTATCTGEWGKTTQESSDTLTPSP